jgi:histone acetyltransferase (RNA polymerase elongator complex component)
MRRWIAPVFLTHAGCAHRCVFCNQHRITGQARRPTGREVGEMLEHLFAQGPRQGPSRLTRQIAFYGGSFTGLPVAVQEEYLGSARRFLEEGLVDSLRVSVRPDGLSRDQLSFLSSRGVRTVEVGIQSLCDEVLERARRGHSAQEAVEALARAKGAGMEVGAQLMVGLPGDTRERALETARRIVRTKVDFVRIYPVLVMKDTELEGMVAEGTYRPLEIGEAVRLCKELVSLYEEASIKVIRIGLHPDSHFRGPDPSWVAGPYHPAFGDLVRSAVFMDKVRGLLETTPLAGVVVSLRVHPGDRSMLQGHRKENIDTLIETFGLAGIRILEDPHLPRGTVAFAEASQAGCAS